MSQSIAIIAHSHPQMSFGGGEIAAHRQFQAMRKKGHRAVFIGLCNDYDLKARLLNENQNMVELDAGDFLARVPNMSSFVMEKSRLEDEDRLLHLLLSLDVDVYHFHHFWKVGAGTIRRLRKARPQAQLVLTTHEFTAICAMHGQMVKADGSTLCHASGQIACARCFPERTPFDFILRKSRLLHMFSLFDRIISPSAFLAGRLADWGVPADRVEVIENGLSYVPELVAETDAELQTKSRRFAFFGNATPTKGLDVLIRAAEILNSRGMGQGVSIDIHGVAEADFARLWPKLTVPSNVVFRGRYDPTEAISLMRRVGWLVIPSTWWENSPVIIQEARAARLPMIYSDIGGMAEKAAGAGLPFSVGDAVALAETIHRVAGDVERLAATKRGIAPPMTMKAYLDAWTKGAQAVEKAREAAT